MKEHNWSKNFCLIRKNLFRAVLLSNTIEPLHIGRFEVNKQILSYDYDLLSQITSLIQTNHEVLALFVPKESILSPYDQKSTKSVSPD